MEEDPCFHVIARPVRSCSLDEDGEGGEEGIGAACSCGFRHSIPEEIKADERSLEKFLEIYPEAACTVRRPEESIQPYPDVQVIETRGKGRGLQAACAISKGTIVCEYLGEILPMHEARKRQKRYDEMTPPLNYVYVLREIFIRGGREVALRTTVDATIFGSVGRFVNHSCDPNMEAKPVRIDAALPRILFCASRDILAGEELTISYGEDAHGGGSKCVCGAEACRGSLPREESLYEEEEKR